MVFLYKVSGSFPFPLTFAVDVLAAGIRHYSPVSAVVGVEENATICVVIPPPRLGVLLQRGGGNQEAIAAVVMAGRHRRVRSAENRLTGNGMDAVGADHHIGR